MRGFAIYQIGHAGRPRFDARVVSQVFDQDQFLRVEIDLIKRIVPDPSGLLGGAGRRASAALAWWASRFVYSVH
jgi:hypothetical protein